jgi:hypothetical protein
VLLLGAAVYAGLAGCGVQAFRTPATYVVRSEDRAEYTQLMQTIVGAGGGESPFGRAWLLERQPCELAQRWENDGKTDEQYFNLALIDPKKLQTGPDYVGIECQRAADGAPTKCIHDHHVIPAASGEELQDQYAFRFKPASMSEAIAAITRLHAICLAARQ